MICCIPVDIQTRYLQTRHTALRPCNPTWRSGVMPDLKGGYMKPFCLRACNVNGRIFIENAKQLLYNGPWIHKENPTRRNSVSTFYFIFIWSSTCFGRHTAHHQEPKTALAASGFAYVEGCWTCSCWTLTASSNYTANNPPRMQNQRRLPVQF